MASVAQVADEERDGRAEDGGHERRGGDGHRAGGGARRRRLGGERNAGEGGHGDGGHDGGVQDLGGVHGQQQPQRKMVVSKKLMKVGPWGGAGGHPWDDGGHTGIRSITLSYDRCIHSITVEYDRDGHAVAGERHGGAGGNQTTQIKLGFPDEYLTAVSGHYSAVAHGGSPVIRSLAFGTNRSAYGPFGAAEGTPFTFPVDGGVIVGFCGRSGGQLDAVGLYVAPLRAERMYDKVQKLGLTAYRAVMHRIGPQQKQQQHQQLNQQNGNV
ncbi:hypothetical protein ACP70R_035753 [Stipagrostis hirtigluma subsp. patula]